MISFGGGTGLEGPPGPRGIAGVDGGAGVGGEVPGGYAEIIANQAGITTTITDITGLSVTVTGNGQPMMVEVWFGAVQNTTAGGAITVYLTDDANTILARGDLVAATGGVSYGPMVVKYRVPAFTGTKTFKVRAQAAVSGTVTILAGSPRRGFIEVTYR